MMSQENNLADSNRPETTFRIGAVKATVWLQQSQQGPFRNVKLTRSYRDGNGNWQEAPTFTARDLPVAIKALQMACEHVLAHDAIETQDKTVADKVPSGDTP